MPALMRFHIGTCLGATVTHAVTGTTVGVIQRGAIQYTRIDNRNRSGSDSRQSVIISDRQSYKRSLRPWNNCAPD